MISDYVLESYAFSVALYNIGLTIMLKDRNRKNDTAINHESSAD